MLNKEHWSDIEGFEMYQVSTLGRVRSKAKTWVIGNGAVRKWPCKLKRPVTGKDDKGRHNRYLRVILFKDGKPHTLSVHRLVAKAFIPNPDNKPQVDHIDNNGHNNRVENLRWVTGSENCQNRRTRNGRR